MIGFVLRYLGIGGGIVYAVMAFVLMDLGWPFDMGWADRAMFLLISGTSGGLYAAIEQAWEDGA